jgi:hypothetical protein
VAGQRFSAGVTPYRRGQQPFSKSGGRHRRTPWPALSKQKTPAAPFERTRHLRPSDSRRQCARPGGSARPVTADGPARSRFLFQSEDKASPVVPDYFVPSPSWIQNGKKPILCLGNTGENNDALCHHWRFGWGVVGAAFQNIRSCPKYLDPRMRNRSPDPSPLAHFFMTSTRRAMLWPLSDRVSNPP